MLLGANHPAIPSKILFPLNAKKPEAKTADKAERIDWAKIIGIIPLMFTLIGNTETEEA